MTGFQGEPLDPRPPTNADEELLDAESARILSELDDEVRLRRISEEIAGGFDAMATVGKAVSVFGSARTLPDDPQYVHARELARALGEAGFAIITGGGPGIMEAANRGARDAGALSVGLGIELPLEQGMNEYVDLGIEFHYFFARKVMFVRYASAFVVCPGGFGTLDELWEAATLVQTGKIRHFPIVLTDTAYWGGMVDWVRDKLCGEGKIATADLDLLRLTDSCAEIVEIVAAAEHRRPRRPAR